MDRKEIMEHYEFERYRKLPENYLPSGIPETDFEHTFEDWWDEIEAFSKQNRIPTFYTEEEFILDGEFIPVHLKFQIDSVEEDDYMEPGWG